VSADGHWLVAMDDRHYLHVYNFVTRELEYEMELKARPTSVSISADSGYLLVNKQDGETLLYDIHTRGSPVRKYTGAVGGKYLIRSSFGGAHESFVVSGSEGLFALVRPATVWRRGTDAARTRWQSGDLAQEHRGSDVQARRPQAAMQRHLVEPDRPVHVCVVRRRRQDQDVSCPLPARMLGEPMPNRGAAGRTRSAFSNTKKPTARAAVPTDGGQRPRMHSGPWFLGP